MATVGDNLVNVITTFPTSLAALETTLVATGQRPRAILHADVLVHVHVATKLLRMSARQDTIRYLHARGTEYAALLFAIVALSA